MNLEKYKIKGPNKRIVLISDIHYSGCFKIQKKLIESIKKLMPDYICIAGDILDLGFYPKEKMNIFLKNWVK
jgi:predicted MPP superfamily phosphohydrolase